jgi:UPF0271 protein
MGLAGSTTERVAAREGVPFIAEAFADRKYESNGRLMSRDKAGSVISDPQEAAAQVLSIILEQRVVSADGKSVPIRAQSICIHGDSPAAIDILRTLDRVLRERGIDKKRATGAG